METTELSDNQPSCNPFKFLDPYSLEDRDYFFGRDQEIADIYRRFYDDRLLLVYGESGAGKTSLIQCGLQTEILQDDAIFVFIRSGISPEHALQEALQKELQKHAITPIPETIPSLLTETIQLYRTRLVIVLDQFEEFFIYQKASYKAHFIQQLNTWLHEHIKLQVIISIREEYYARLDEMEETFPSLYDNRLRVKRITWQQAHTIITKSCQKGHIAIEKGLTHTVLQDLSQIHQEFDLPILQIVLDSLYRKAVEVSPQSPMLTLQDYTALGKITKIVDRFLEQRLQTYDNPEIIRQLLKTLISTEGTRKSSTLEQINESLVSFGYQLNESEINTILQQLNHDRIIRDIDNKLYELRHDVLAKPIQRWMTDNETEIAELRQSIATIYQEYERRGTLLSSELLKAIEPYLHILKRDKNQAEFIEASQKAISKKNRRLYFISTATLLFILVVVLFSWSVTLKEKKKAEDLIEFMNESLSEKLKLIGKTDLMLDVQEEVNDYYNNTKLNSRNYDSLRGKAIALLQYANTLDKIGKNDQAKQYYSEAHELFKKIAKEKDDSSNQHYLSKSFNKIGAIEEKSNNNTEAMNAYKKSLLINKKLVKDNPDSLDFQRALAVSLIYRGDMYKKTGQFDKARRDYNKVHQLIKNITTKQPDKDKWQHDLSISYRRLGDMFLQEGKTEDALIHYYGSLKITERLYEKAPNIPLWQRILSVSYTKLGTLYLVKGSRTQSIMYYQKAVDLREKLIASDTNNSGWKRDYYASLLTLGSVYIGHDNNKALHLSQQALKVAKDRIKKNPNELRTKYDIYIIYNQIAHTYDKNGDSSKAISFYKNACHLINTLSKNDKYNIPFQFELANCYLTLNSVRGLENTNSLKIVLDNLLVIKGENKLLPKQKEIIKNIKLVLDK